MKLTKSAKTEYVSTYLLELITDSLLEEPGLDLLIIYLDNNSTHKGKMKQQLQEKLDEFYRTHNLTKLPQIQFEHIPPYSPDYNLAEYVIRLTRQRLLHHLPVNTTLEQIETRLNTYFDNHQLQTPEQIQKTLNHILKLGVGRE